MVDKKYKLSYLILYQTLLKMLFILALLITVDLYPIIIVSLELCSFLHKKNSLIYTITIGYGSIFLL